MSKFEKTFAGGNPLTANELNQMTAAINDNDDKIASLRKETNTKFTELEIQNNTNLYSHLNLSQWNGAINDIVINNMSFQYDKVTITASSTRIVFSFFNGSLNKCLASADLNTNNEWLPIKVYLTEQTDIQVNDIVGYIKFNSYQTISSNPDYTDSTILNLLQATTLYRHADFLISQNISISDLLPSGKTIAKISIFDKNYNIKINDYPMWSSLYETNWKDAIEEIYLPKLTNASVTTNSTKFYITGYVDSQIVANARIEPTANGVIYPLVIYDSLTSEFPVGTILGYVIFKDYQKFLTYTSTQSNNFVNVKRFINPAYNVICSIYYKSPVSVQANYNTGTKVAKINAFGVKTDIYVPENIVPVWSFVTTQWENTIKEFFVSRNDISITDICITTATENNNFVAQFLSNGIHLGFAKCNPTSNNMVYELNVYNVPTDSPLIIGEIIGYVIFNNYEPLFTYPSTSGRNKINTSFCFNENVNPTILTYINVKVIQIETTGRKVATLKVAGKPTDIYIGDTKGIPVLHFAKKIYGVVNDTLQIYKRGICQSVNPYNYMHYFSPSSNINNFCKLFPRYFRITSEQAVNGAISYKIITNDYFESDVKNSDVIISGTPSSPTENINVLCLGSSTTTDGVWAGELRRRLTQNGGTPVGLGLTNISFVGRLNGVSVQDIKVEAVGGWSFSSYIKGVRGIKFTASNANQIFINTRYSYVDSNGQTSYIVIEETENNNTTIKATWYYNSPSILTPPSTTGTLTRVTGTGDETINFTNFEKISYSPFIDNDGNFGFTNYANKYCNGSIDVMPIMLTCLNYGIYGNASLTNIMNDVKTFLNTLHRDFPNCKVLLSPGVGCNALDGQGDSLRWGTLVVEMRFQDAIEDMIESETGYSNWVFMPNMIAEVDMDYAFPTTEQEVNPRQSETEKVATNLVHPNTLGSKMTADSFYRCFVCTIL